MVQVNFSKHTLNCKVVFAGPEGAGKTTTLQAIARRLPAREHSELTSIRADDGVAFDYLRLDLGVVDKLRTQVHLYTLPASDRSERTRRSILVGVDAVVFVADARPARLEANRYVLATLESEMLALGIDRDTPVFFQWTHLDAEDALDPESMQRAINYRARPAFETHPVRGDGVLPTVKRAAWEVLERFGREYAQPRTETRSVPRPRGETRTVSRPETHRGMTTSARMRAMQEMQQTQAGGAPGTRRFEVVGTARRKRGLTRFFR